MDCSPPGSSVHGIFQARILRWVAISFSRGIFLTQGSNPCVLQLAGFGRWILYGSATREVLRTAHLPTTHGSPRRTGSVSALPTIVSLVPEQHGARGPINKAKGILPTGGALEEGKESSVGKETFPFFPPRFFGWSNN